jgi:gamma-glutamylcyclotransferase (GGCT)/AIG2-like uncharacterized protein YtfP
LKNADQCHVFVYGTLKPDQSNFEQYCADKVIAQQQAIAYGELFVLPMGYPAMIVGNCPVYGYLLSFNDDSILESLDELEAYQSDRAFAENLYNRQQIEVFDIKGMLLGTAWAYFMTLFQVIKLGGISQPNGLFCSNTPFPPKK